MADEDQIQDAERLLTEFRSNPADPQYRAQAREAADRRAEAEKREAGYRKKQQERRHLFQAPTAYGFGPLTFALMVISVTVFILSGMGKDFRPIQGLFIRNFVAGGSAGAGLPEVLQGQVWRLVTPIFIHFNLLHILFNLLWLHDLGSMIEGRQSTGMLARLVLGLAVVSNLVQFWFGGPVFGGMSGVVYGLLGYIWMRGKFDPGSGLYLHPTTLTMMILWFFACFTPIVPHVANAAHAGGLVMGIAWGYLSSLRYR